MKHPGIERDHGIETLEEFLEVKHIFIDYGYRN